MSVDSTMTGKVAVFLGPSLPLKQAREVLNARYLPPARKGDIYCLLSTGVKVIVLIDGLFHDTPSIWHREILDALSEGIRVFGASSMGALRAAELYPYGMEGIGTIYNWYRDGIIQGDDEVALHHGGADVDFLPMSEPLVNIRYTLLQMVESGVLTSGEANALVSHARKLYYPERSYQKILECLMVRAQEHERVRELKRYLQSHRVNLKAMDALAALKLVTIEPKRFSCIRNANETRSGSLWSHSRGISTCFPSPRGEVRAGVLLDIVTRDTLKLKSLWLKLVKQAFLLEWARQNNIICPPKHIDTFGTRWQERYAEGNTFDWLRANGLTPVLHQRLLSERALVDWLISRGPEAFGLTWDYGEASSPPSPSTDSSGVKPMELLESSSAEYRFLVAWAKQNGVSRSGGMLVEWILQVGPTHFGLYWRFEQVLLEELQITGEATKIVGKIMLSEIATKVIPIRV